MRITIVIAILGIYSAFALPCGFEAFAQSGTPSATVQNPGSVEIGQAIIPPNSPIYFLKMIRENLELKFSKPNSDTEKVIQYMEFAQRRLREVKTLIVKNHQDLIEPTVQKYRNNLEIAGRVSPDNSIVMSELSAIRARHLDVLMRLYDETGDPNGKRLMRATIIDISEDNASVLDKLKGREPLEERVQELEPQIKIRQLPACQFMVREASSSALNQTEQFVMHQKAVDCLKTLK
jgi:hypothetical protein